MKTCRLKPVRFPEFQPSWVFNQMLPSDALTLTKANEIFRDFCCRHRCRQPTTTEVSSQSFHSTQFIPRMEMSERKSTHLVSHQHRFLTPRPLDEARIDWVLRNTEDNLNLKTLTKKKKSYQCMSSCKFFRQLKNYQFQHKLQYNIRSPIKKNVSYISTSYRSSLNLKAFTRNSSKL